MDVKKIEKHLKVENLESYIVDLIIDSKIDAESKADTLIDELKLLINKNHSKKELLSIALISNLVYVRKIIYNNENTNFDFYINNFKGGFFNIFKKENNNNYKNDLAKFIIKTIGSFELSELFTIGKFERLKTEIPSYYFRDYLLDKLPNFFIELNELNLIKDFNWSISTLEAGISELYKDLYLKYESQINQLGLKIEFENKKYKSEKDHFDYRIDRLNSELEISKNTIEYYKDYTKKYLENQPYYVQNTYFGDNLPFLINVYNFLVKHQLLIATSWSYFYCCFVIEEKEIINLTSKGNLKLIGRVFYNLQDFLLPKYKNDFNEFLMNKFYVNEKPINQNFFKNHMRPIFDEIQYSELIEVDNFFLKQKEIYLKTE